MVNLEFQHFMSWANIESQSLYAKNPSQTLFSPAPANPLIHLGLETPPEKRVSRPHPAVPGNAHSNPAVIVKYRRNFPTAI